MKRTINMLAVAVGLSAALAAGVSAAAASRASGAGHIGTGQEGRMFSFTAVQQADGQVVGRAVLHARTFPATVHTRITCLRVEGDTAYLSGVNTKADPEFFEGVWVIFGVRDGGEGAGATDQITSFHQAATQGPNACVTDSPPTDWIPIERGNVQVG